MEEEGVVVATEGDIAKVKVKRHSDCENCGACPGNQAMLVDVRNPLGAHINQRVGFRIQESNMLKAAFVVFILPLAASVVGYIGVQFLAEHYSHYSGWMGTLGAVTGFLTALLYIRNYDRSARKNRGMLPVAYKIIDD